MSRSFKKNVYQGSRKFDKSCRCNGGCEWCEGDRKHKYKKSEFKAEFLEKKGNKIN